MATIPDSLCPVERDQDAPPAHPLGWYDRSSLRGDFLVLIPNQTEAEYHLRHPSYPFCEFIDGTVYMHAAVSYEHQEYVNILLLLVQMYNIARPVGYLTTGPAPLKVRDGCYLEPDLFVLPIDFDPGRDQLAVSPPALLIVEVLSPSNRETDLGIKAELYREARAAEVWFIDGRDKVVLVDRRAGDGREFARVESGPLRSSGLPGFWIDVDWLWASPRPNLMRCFEQILAGPPG